MSVENEQPFPGSPTGTLTIVVVGPAVLEAKGADGSWVAVPDGAQTDTVFSVNAPFGSIFRLTGMSGPAAVFG